MAALATARSNLSFHLHPPSPLRARPRQTHLPCPRIPRPPLPLLRHSTVRASLDVSKEDQHPPERRRLPQSEADEPPAEAPAAEVPRPEEEKFDKRRLEERFAVLNTGIYECRSCGYRYDQAAGDPSYPIPPGLSFEKLPGDWRCPTCGAAQSFFVSRSVEIAGFAQNQQFGLGGNSLTSGQKASLIYGTLLFFFVLFLLGYFLQ